MKNLFLIVFSALFSFASIAQITPNSTYPLSGEFYLTKFSNAGYKYVRVNYATRVINLYNINHTVFKSIPFATPSIQLHELVALVTDQLFDQNNNIEYVLQTKTNTTEHLQIFDENGTQVFHEDSLRLVYYSYVPVPNLVGTQSILYNGNNYQMLCYKTTSFSPYEYKLFDLPGSLPCISCSTFTTPGVVTSNGGINGDPTRIDPSFFPNPVTDQLKLKYSLPTGYKTAEIKITDLQGKEVEVYKVDSHFEFIYVPSNYNNGMYIYTLIVDGVALKTEKIIISK